MENDIIEIRKNLENVKKYWLNKLAFTITPTELERRLGEEPTMVLDIRDRKDYDESHIPESFCIPYDELTEDFDMLSKNSVIVVVSYNPFCHRGIRACLLLAEYGFQTIHLEGGFSTWEKYYKFPTTSTGL